MPRRRRPGSRPCYFVTYRGLGPLAAVEGVPPLRHAEHGGLAVETSERGRGGNRLRNLRRNFEHTLGINACMARLARDAARVGHPRPYWWSEAEATRRFRYEGSTFWIRPDAAGIYYLGKQRHPFLFEYDRGTMRHRDYMRKLAGLVAFFASETAEDIYGRHLNLLVVSESHDGERRFASAISASEYREGIDLHALLTTTELIRSNGLGLLGPIWWELGQQRRRTWLGEIKMPARPIGTVP
ncbi:MAG: replication-relaxation family protein [Dehalococcoidia bacterium]